MNNLTKTAIAVLVASLAAMIWGFEYRADHQMAALGAFFGHGDPLYDLAGWASGLGVLAFLVGIALLISGLVQGGNPRPPSPSQTERH